VKVTSAGVDGVAGGGEIVSLRDEIARVANELAAQRAGDDRALIEEAREMVMTKLGKVE
jgi:hypothetical protein